MTKLLFITVCYVSLTTVISKLWPPTCTFEKSFIFSTATSSYQVEGGWDADGKGPSVWDYITQNNVGNLITDNSTGNIACDSYHKFKEDVQMLKYLGVDAYRFSLSWPRLLPDGKAPNGLDSINPGGRDYYNNLINEVIANGVTPMVTLFHWDLPLNLMSQGGFQTEQIVGDFEQYADLAFQLFGDRVHYWFTFNEPDICCEIDWLFARDNPELNEPGIAYRCSKNLLLSHAKAYRLYHAKYNPKKIGKMSMVINSVWYAPKSIRISDLKAADRFMEFMTGIWAHPIFIGDYPHVIKTYIEEASLMENLTSSKLPTFTEEEIDLIRGTSDIYSVNYYTSRLTNKSRSNSRKIISEFNAEIESDAQVETSVKDSWQLAPAGNSIYIVPEGLGKLLKYIKKKYGNPEILITENGIGDKGGLNDTIRIDYLKAHLKQVCKAKRGGANVIGYTLWSLMDNFEWLDGYQTKFGVYSVDFNDPERNRTLKESATWYRNLIKIRKL